MHKSATKCNETLGKWYKNKYGASKIIDTLEMYHPARPFLIVTALKVFVRPIILVCTLMNFSMPRLGLVSALRRSGASLRVEQQPNT
jgi:hypothetical protein